MAQDAHIGAGSKLQRGDGASPENFVDVLGIKGINGPGITRDSVETTDMATGGWRTFTPGLKDGGEVTFDANFLPAEPTQNQSAGGLMAEFDSDSCAGLRNWRIVLPPCDGEPDAYWEFAGFLTGQEIEQPLDDVMAFSGTLKVSGRPALIIEASA